MTRFRWSNINILCWCTQSNCGKSCHTMGTTIMNGCETYQYAIPRMTSGNFATRDPIPHYQELDLLNGSGLATIIHACSHSLSPNLQHFVRRVALRRAPQTLSFSPNDGIMRQENRKRQSINRESPWSRVLLQKGERPNHRNLVIFHISQTLST